MDSEDALHQISEQIERKEALRSSDGWHLPDQCILVLSIPDCPFSELLPSLTEDLALNFAENGFLQIWLADHSEMEEYLEIELFALKPHGLWGHYPRDRGKPFA